MISTLPSSVSAWEFVQKMIAMHQEYNDPALMLDAEFGGEKKTMEEWLALVASKYPRENVLHTGLMILGLMEIDPVLQQELPNEVVLAYATTIHKSQGSEYLVVVMPISTVHYNML